jgi:hypothetical protein
MLSCLADRDTTIIGSLAASAFVFTFVPRWFCVFMAPLINIYLIGNREYIVLDNKTFIDMTMAQNSSEAKAQTGVRHRRSGARVPSVGRSCSK